MKTPPTSSKTIRLPPEVWPMFRRLMRYHGRHWLIQFIVREHKKLPDQIASAEEKDENNG